MSLRGDEEGQVQAIIALVIFLILAIVLAFLVFTTVLGVFFGGFIGVGVFVAMFSALLIIIGSITHNAGMVRIAVFAMLAGFILIAFGAFGGRLGVSQ